MADNIFRSPDPQTYQQGVPYEPPLATIKVRTGQDIPSGPEIGGGEGQVAAVINVRGLGPIVVRAPSGEQLNRLREDPQTLNRYLDDRFSEFRGFVDTIYRGMSPMDKAALWTSPIPIVGDVAGIVADAANYIQDPEARSLANGLITLMSAVPLVPNKRLMDQAEQVKRNITAWHGSPHKFDRFSMAHIGTGEGAQAYGHGLYFAENPDVARQYRDTLGSGKAAFNVQAAGPGAVRLAARVADEGLTADDLVRLADGDGLNVGQTNFVKRMIEEGTINEFVDSANKNKGALYRTTLNVDPDDLLDWDAPLSQQPNIQRKLLRQNKEWNDYISQMDDESAKIAEDMVLGKIKIDDDSSMPYWKELQKKYPALDHNAIIDMDYQINPRTSGLEWTMGIMSGNTAPGSGVRGGGGADFYNSLGTPEEAASKLKELGIPGIRYLDGNSRSVSGGEILGAFQGDDGMWRSKIKVNNRGGTTFQAPTQQFTTSMPFGSKEDALKWAEGKINTGSRNYVIFDDSLINIDSIE
jgi:hypothetical protein